MSSTSGADRFWLNVIYIVSILLTTAIAYLILGPRPEGMDGSLDVSYLPTVNAVFNGITTLLLLTGYILIRKQKKNLHKKVMMTAFGTSGGFLISYVLYHWFKSGPKLYGGEFTEVYYFILLTHILFAIIISPLALLTLYRGWTEQEIRHRKIAKITLPIWLYVSVTGVLIYWMLYY